MLTYGAGVNDQPLREPTLLILTAIADAPRHGYAIAQEVEKISEGRTKMRTGTLYGALERLLEQELIAVHEDEVVDGAGGAATPWPRAAARCWPPRRPASRAPHRKRPGAWNWADSARR